MDRELLIEIGTEELPASWLPGLTVQIGTAVEAELEAQRLGAGAPVETYSTGRRLTARVGKIAERQPDLEDLVTGPPVSAAFGKDGQPTPAATGFARKVGVDVTELEQVEVPDKKGVYLAFRRQVRGKAAVDVLPDVLTGVLRKLSFPKAMRWDATLDDGRGELLFGRPIRWLLFLYGGRVVPFTIFRTARAEGPLVQEVRSGAVTYGHRFLTTSGRAGRAIKVKGFDDYHKRLAENFVVLERSERHDRIARELDVEARRHGGRVATALIGHALLDEVPDLVEYPAVVAGAFAGEFLALPEEVLTTTMIHHQHFFPLVSDAGALLPNFLAVLNMAPEKPEIVSRNLERVLTARLRDARFFWEADRERPLDGHIDRLGTVLFHKALGSYREKATRVAALARWIAADVLGLPAEAAGHAETAGRLSKADLATDMVRELTELQGTMGGIYAREDGQPEAVWKAIYHHYQPVGIEADAPPARADLGEAAGPWAAVALADKLDTLVGMFAAGERPTGSRDPYGLRRAAQGLVRLLVDLPELTGIDARLSLGPLVAKAREPFAGLAAGEEAAEREAALWAFLGDRIRYVLEHRGADVRNVRAVTHGPVADVSPLVARRKLETLPEVAETAGFRQLAELFKRVRNIARNLDQAAFEAAEARGPALASALVEPAERALNEEIEARRGAIEGAVAAGQGFREAFAEAAKFGPSVARFFDDVLVMAEDASLREARLRLMKRLEALILSLADVSEIVPQTES
ncbi:MAG: glycine--tRNA ligase subunit beta [Vicinamibacterales bacterium]